MLLIDQLAEARIAEAVQEGKLENLEGMGKPLQLDDDSMVPAELRMAYRVMKNSGFLPPEVVTRKSIEELQQLLDTADDTVLREAASRRLKLLMDKLSLQRGDTVNLLAEDLYARKLTQRLSK